ncbi:hypothetical protein [Achromobacter xylosoxidans]|uniref:hypothetical protein n=1 Tax=Alcaligenes xylosoxydans xylosoxydans TaxID=85698 RepID=UPI0012AA65CD|nr:hypothetical protein [Achromobacter xylosoxidans]CUR70311.1 hypothetical protein BN2877_57580 [Achromobacter xylosoxidans]
MGLDISAYARIKKLDAVFDDDGDPIDPTTREPLEYDLRVYCNPDFPGRADDLTHRGVYIAEDSLGFSAGGYGRYNMWRNELAKMAGYPKGTYKQYGSDFESYCVACWNGEQGPFAELICFSDCEGAIGSKVAAKLASDFAAFDERAKAHDAAGWFYEQYQEWRAAFELAADNGAVSLH